MQQRTKVTAVLGDANQCFVTTRFCRSHQSVDAFKVVCRLSNGLSFNGTLVQVKLPEQVCDLLDIAIANQSRANSSG